MRDVFFFVGLPYMAMFAFVVGMIYRMRSDPFSQSAQTSQFLESKSLLWGIIPFHAGLFVVLFLHAVVFVIPTTWQGWMGYYPVLIAVETIGLAASALCLIGLLVLAWRRLTTARIQRVTTTMDLVVLALIVAQVISGISMALGHRWGAAWAPGTMVPYLRSLLFFSPDVSFVIEMPPMIKLHIIGAWVIILVIPFSRLGHFLALPLAYFVRPPQKVVWNNARFVPADDDVRVAASESRRLFLRGAGGVGAASALLTIGTADKLVRFFRGPEMTDHEKSELLTKRLSQLRLTAEQRELELERMGAQYVSVAQYSELSVREGKYFIDFKMQPAMAFLQENGLPLVLSAKCTHLGCTVGNKVDAKGRVLCPCHVSYFDIKTGQPNEGAPATTPLPRLGWALMGPDGAVVASQSPTGKVEGVTDPDVLRTCRLYIARPNDETA